MTNKTPRFQSLEERVQAYKISGPHRRDFFEIYDMITLESSLKRIWDTLQRPDYSFAVISGFQSEDVTDGINTEAGLSHNLKISTKARCLDFGYVWVMGHWKTVHGQNIEEDALLIFASPKETNALKDFLVEMSSLYGVKAYALKPKGESHLYIVHQDGSKEDCGVFDPDRIGENYSEMRMGKDSVEHFVLESLWGIQTPSNHRAIVARLKKGS